MLILGGPLFLIGFAYRLLSPREWAWGFIAWFAAVVLWTLLRKRVYKKTLVESTAEPAIALDDDARKLILQEIWVRKAWIAIFAVLLVIGIADGVTHRAWLPTLTGGAVSLSLMYALAQRIKQQRDRLDLSRGPK